MPTRARSTGRVLGFFDQTDDAAILVKLGHAVLLRLLHPGEHDLAVPLAVGELAIRAADAALDDVVAQEHHETVVTQEIPADLDGVGQPQRADPGECR